ncbi:MAG TPA: response regulator transcription factor [Gemmatimonadales bacterium]|jgi:DNA-binding NarL/FixJ family response regulator
MPIRILLADDHGVLRAGLRALLANRPDFEVVGEAENGVVALALASSLHPDVVLLDLQMPPEGGLAIARKVRSSCPGTRVLFLSVHEDPGLVEAGFAAGASGYCPKSAVEADLLTAVAAVGRGEVYVHPSLDFDAEHISKLGSPAREPTAAPRLPSLTPRELDVLRLITEGCTNRQIAQRLGIGIRTVESHRAHLLSKLHARSRVDLVQFAKQSGLGAALASAWVGLMFSSTWFG